MPRLVNGYILFVTLLLLQLFSLLAVDMLNKINQVRQSESASWQLHKVNFAIGQVIDQLTLQYQPGQCEVGVKDPDYFRKKKFKWWRMHTCSGNLFGFRYYYVAEHLGEDPCAFLAMVNKQLIVADYYRLTIMVNHPFKKITSLSQETIISPRVSSLSCGFKLRQVKRGRQMRRELS